MRQTINKSSELCGCRRNGLFLLECDNTSPASLFWRGVATGLSEGQARLTGSALEDLNGGTSEDTEHDVTHDFGYAANTDKQCAKVVFELGVDAFHGRALFESPSCSWFHGDFFSSTRIGVDDGNVSELLGVGTNFLCIEGGIHQVIADHWDALMTHLRQGDGNLRVMERCGSKDSADRNISVDDVQMEFITDPRVFEALSIFLGTAVTYSGQIEEVFGQGTFQLQLQAFEWDGFNDLSFARTTPFFWSCWNGFGIGNWFFTCGNCRGITADVTNHHIAQVFFNHGFMDLLGQMKLGEVGKRAGESGFRRNLGECFPTDETAQARTVFEVVKEGSVGSEIPNGFRNESFGNRESVFWFSSNEYPPKGAHKTFDIGEFDDCNEALAFIGKNADFILQHREELALDDKSSGGKAHEKRPNWLLTMSNL
jgi:hypothetical protein